MKNAVLMAVSLALLSACVDGNDSITEPVRASQSEEQVWWVGNTLEFTDDEGHSWRVVRDQEDATEASFLRNDSLVLTVRFTHEQSTVTEIRWEEPEEEMWAESDAEGDVFRTRFGDVCPPCDPEGPCEPCEMFQDDCSGIFWTATGATATTVLSGIGLVATLKVPGLQPFAKSAIVATASSGMAAGGAWAAYAICRKSSDYAQADDHASSTVQLACVLAESPSSA
jgi:hypothetical protein